MEFSQLKSDPLWKEACLFGRMLIKLEESGAPCGLKDMAHQYMQTLTRALVSVNVASSQDGLSRTLEQLRDVESQLNDFFTISYGAEIELKVYFRLEQLREMIFHELSDERSLCSA